MAKRQTIGDNPLDTLIPHLDNDSPVATISQESDRETVPSQNSSKQRVTVQISTEVIDRVKNAVYWTPGLTLACLAEQALSEAVDELEREQGKKFPRRREELKSGRPLK